MTVFVCVLSHIVRLDNVRIFGPGLTSEEVRLIPLGHDDLRLCLPIDILNLVLRLKPQIAHDILAHFYSFFVGVVNLSWGSDIGQGLFRLGRIGGIAVLAIKAIPNIVFPEGENRMVIARDGDNNSSHWDHPF